MLAYMLKRRRAHIDNRNIIYVDPLHAGRHPFQLFLLGLCMVSALTLFLAGIEPGSLEALTLHPVIVYMWNISLVGGAIMAFTGIYWRGEYDTALTLERVGLNFSGIFAVIYGIIIVTAAGFSAVVAASITVGFGVACLRRARDIGIVFYAAQHTDPTPEPGDVEVLREEY